MLGDRIQLDFFRRVKLLFEIVDVVSSMVNSKGKMMLPDSVAFMICKTKHALKGCAGGWPVIPPPMPKLVFL